MARKSIKEQIKEVLKKYFEEDDRGHKNEEYNPHLSAQETIDEIRDIIGGI